MVMSEDERTQVMNADRRQPTRYDQYAEVPDDEDPKAKRRRRTIAAVLGALFVLGAVLLIMWLSGAFKGNDAKTVAIPDVMRYSLPQARAKLNSSGFNNIQTKTVTCGGAQQPTDGINCTADDANKVVAVDPTVGTQVSTASQITLTVGQAPGKATVPDLSGKTRDEAQTALSQAKLTLDPNVQEQEVSDPNQVGKVISQNPAANQQVDEGSQVSITIGKGQQQKQVPDYTGKSFNEAKAGLTALGFNVKRVDQASNDVQKDNVINQTPNGGQAAVGSTITLTVSTGPNQIQMPDLTGMTPDEAQAKLQSMGWTGTLNKTADHTGKGDPGTIVKQNPSPGTTISANQTITVAVNEGSGFPIPTLTTTPTSRNGG
jgi:serine/threonine-protein kinase